MIKIVNPNLEEIAQRHFTALKPIIEARLKKNKELQTVIEQVCSLGELILGSPEALEEVSLKLKEKGIDMYKQEATKVFDYTSFSSKTSEYSAYKLTESLGVNVCSYCNRQYTFTVRKVSHDVTRPEFDHFLNKSKYPFLALSFYNLIPSCKICNSTLKGDKDWSISTHIHPYKEGFENKWRFSLRPRKGKGVDFFYGKEDAFDIVGKCSGDIKVKKNVEDLKLLEIYNQHKDYVSDIIKNAVVHDQSYLDSLYEQYEGTLFGSKEDLYRMVFYNYQEGSLGKRVLGKLTKDVLEELRL